MQFIPGQLVLKSGEQYSGRVPATLQGIFFGEVVFNTGMVGYVETLTDPSYAGQDSYFYLSPHRQLWRAR